MPGTAIELASTLTDEQVRLIKDTIIPGASNDELALFVNQCNRTGLDAFSKQIYSIKRYSSATHSSTYQVQVSIDGARLIAQRSGEYAGQTPCYWCGADGIWVDTEGLSVMTAWAAGKFVGDAVGPFIKKSGIEEKVAHKKLIIPGYAAGILGDLEEELPGWEIMIGPREAGHLPGYLKLWKA